MNRDMGGDDRPEHIPHFLQPIPKSILTEDRLTPADVAEAATQLVGLTSIRIGKWEVPFRKPRVEFTALLPHAEPGHIEFGWDETLIRIHPQYAGNPFALAAILCHELAHFILDHNGWRGDSREENEMLTDLFVFRCGQGLIYLQGVHDVTYYEKGKIESKLGYLSLEMMAYAHVRCASQHGLLIEDIFPNAYRGLSATAYDQVLLVIKHLTLKSKDSAPGHLAEIILCPNDHVLRLSEQRTSQHIRCPKCGWQQEVWLHKKEHVAALVERGTQDFNAGDLRGSLSLFRNAQEIDNTYTAAYCGAARCLKRLGAHQDAIRELRKLLTIRPNDSVAQEEMKKLMYQ